MSNVSASAIEPGASYTSFSIFVVSEIISDSFLYRGFSFVMLEVVNLRLGKLEVK